jgi:hypothetical protein
LAVRIYIYTPVHLFIHPGGKRQKERKEGKEKKRTKANSNLPTLKTVAGGTKNAIDYLCNEWKGKPVSIVSYGAQGGKLSSQQAKEVLTGMGLRVADARVQLAFADVMAEIGAIMAEGKFSDASRTKWEGQSAEIVKAAEELKQMLLQPNAEENVPKA